jgi:hypothetical protein
MKRLDGKDLRFATTMSITVIFMLSFPAILTKLPALVEDWYPSYHGAEAIRELIRKSPLEVAAYCMGFTLVSFCILSRMIARYSRNREIGKGGNLE